MNSEVHSDTLGKSIPSAQPQITDRRKGELIRQTEEEIRELMEEPRRMREIRAQQEREREEKERMERNKGLQTSPLTKVSFGTSMSVPGQTGEGPAMEGGRR